MTTVRLPVLAAFAAITLAGCGGGGSNEPAANSPPPPPPAATFSASSGVAQKGPLILGSAITAQELNATLVPTGRQYSYQTNSDFGTFNPNSAFTSQYLGVVASGYYFDEVTNTLSTGPIALQAYADLSAAQVLNVNLLTTLAYQRIQTLVSSGTTFANARSQAEREVLAALSILNPEGIGPFGTLDLGKGTDGDKILAAISSVFSYGNTPANLAALIASVQSDIGANGRITSNATLTTLAASAGAVNPAVVAANLNQRYASTGATLVPADIANWIDHDGDGVVAGMEFQVANASPSSVFTLPAAFVVKNAGALVSVSAGLLSINGSPIAGSGEIRAGDVVTVSAPAGPFPNGIAKVYVLTGLNKLARVSFVAAVQSISVTPTGLSLPAGITQQFEALGTLTDSSTANLTSMANWQSSFPAIASVASSGVATAKVAGSTVISASFGAISGSATLNVLAPILQSISLSSTGIYVAPGVNRQLTATGHYSDGTTGNITSTATWSTGDTAFATVTAGLVTGVALGTTSVTATSGTKSASATVNVSSKYWAPAASGPPGSGYGGFTATLLPDGRVLVAMGMKGAPCLCLHNEASIYDPITDTWATAASWIEPVAGHTATLLSSGKVLIAGGLSPTGTRKTSGLYDPVANTWSEASPMPFVRGGHTATLLADGRVLVAGGGGNAGTPLYDHAEIYHPIANAWTAAGTMATPRAGHAAILLSNGKVLVAGGRTAPNASIASAELYDPATNLWSPAGTMAGARSDPTIAALPDGRVLVAGGSTLAVQWLNTAEIYDPAANSWSPAATLREGRAGNSAIELPNGQVLVLAGNWPRPPTTAEIYDPALGAWLEAPPLLSVRSGETATLLSDGSVFVFGGNTDAGELYQ